MKVYIVKLDIYIYTKKYSQISYHNGPGDVSKNRNHLSCVKIFNLNINN
jgi:hypothetical protein